MSKKSVMRGLHFQWNPYMGKLVRTVQGRMVDMFMDIRKNSPTYGKICMYDMPCADDKGYCEWIWVPPGFAHGNYFTEEVNKIEYLCTGEYSQGCEAGISPLADDIDWLICPSELKTEFDSLVNSSELILSEKDKAGVTLSTWEADERSVNFIYGKC